MAKNKEPEQIVETTQQVGGQVYPIPGFDDVNVHTVTGVGQVGEELLDTPFLPPPEFEPPFDASVGEVTKTFEGLGSSDSPYGEEQSVSVKHSDVKYDTNNDPILGETPNVTLAPRDRVQEGTTVAKPFPPRHDQAGYLVDSGDPVLIVKGQDRKNWYLNDELPFVAEVISVTTGSMSVMRKAISGDPQSGAATLTDLLDKDGSTVTYDYVTTLKPNSGYSDYTVGDTVLVHKRGRYYFATSWAGLPTGTVNAMLRHDGTAWEPIRFGVAKIVSNDGSGDYTIAEQIWNTALGTPAWSDLAVVVTGDGVPSPNGTYYASGASNGRVYYERTDGAFVDFWAGAAWVISTAPGVLDPSWARTDPDIEGAYVAQGTYTGDPVVAATPLSARDISQNANGAVDDFVIFWQQYDDNGDIETVMVLVTGPSPATDPFIKGFWFDVTGDMAWADVDATNDYLNREVETAAFHDGGAPVDNGSWGEDDVYIYDVNDGARPQANGQCQMRYVGGNTAIDPPILFVDKTATLGDFYLRVEGATGRLQAKSENFQNRYQVRVSIHARDKTVAADAVDIS